MNTCPGCGQPVELHELDDAVVIPAEDGNILLHEDCAEGLRWQFER